VLCYHIWKWVLAKRKAKALAAEKKRLEEEKKKKALKAKKPGYMTRTTSKPGAKSTPKPTPPLEKV